MARNELLLLLSLSAAFVVSLVGAAAPAPAPSSSLSENACMDLAINELISCLNYAAAGSNLTKPSKECCTGLSSFVKKGPSCICTLLANASALAATVGVDVARVMNMPSLCKVDAKLDHCKTGVPALGPMPAEGSASSPSAGAGGSDFGTFALSDPGLHSRAEGRSWILGRSLGRTLGAVLMRKVVFLGIALGFVSTKRSAQGASGSGRFHQWKKARDVRPTPSRRPTPSSEDEEEEVEETPLLRRSPSTQPELVIDLAPKWEEGIGAAPVEGECELVMRPMLASCLLSTTDAPQTSMPLDVPQLATALAESLIAVPTPFDVPWSRPSLECEDAAETTRSLALLECHLLH